MFSQMNKEFLIFLFFLFLSGVFWLMMTLNETYEKEVAVPVNIVGVPKSMVVTSDVEDTLRVTVRDKGYTLVFYLYSDYIKPIVAAPQELERNPRARSAKLRICQKR